MRVAVHVLLYMFVKGAMQAFLAVVLNKIREVALASLNPQSMFNNTKTGEFRLRNGVQWIPANYLFKEWAKRVSHPCLVIFPPPSFCFSLLFC